MINKKFNAITMKDLAKTGVYDGIDFQDYVNRSKNGDKTAVQELENIFEKGDMILKDTLVNQKMNKIQSEYKIVDTDFNLITTDYFIDNIGALTVIGSRVVKPGPEEVIDRNKHWYIEGFITKAKFKQFPELYQRFKDKYNNYNTDNWKLELNVIGGITAGYVSIDREELMQWREDGVFIEPWGFNQDKSIICYTELLIETRQEFKKKANNIRQKGRIDSMEDLKTLMLDDEGQEIFNSIFKEV